jgi:hypothetical protein
MKTDLHLIRGTTHVAIFYIADFSGEGRTDNDGWAVSVNGDENLDYFPGKTVAQVTELVFKQLSW